MLKVGFAGMADFESRCTQAASRLTDECDTCSTAIGFLYEEGFSGLTATAAQRSFLQWFASVSDTTIAFATAAQMTESAIVVGSVVKDYCERIPASIGAPSSICGRWDSSYLAIDGAASLLAQRATNISTDVGVCLASEVSSIYSIALGLSCGSSILQAVEDLRTVIQQVSTQLDLLSQAIEKACSSASAFETEQHSRAVEIGQALSLSVSGEADFGSSLMGLDWAGALFGQARDTGIEAAFVITHNAMAKEVLQEVGIKQVGSVVLKDGYLIYSGFVMAEGSQKMTTRCLASNAAELERPSAVSKANRIKKIGPLRGNAAAVVFDGGLSFYEEYANGDPNRTDDRKLSDATVETGITVGFDLAAIGVGAAIGSFGGPVGTAVGAVVGVAVGVGLYLVNDGVIHGENEEGRSIADDIKDGFYDFWETKQKDCVTTAQEESNYEMPEVSEYVD